jgi:hypothetical protein
LWFYSKVLQNDAVAMHIVPYNLEIVDLERQAKDYERKAETESEPKATQLREAARERRAWIAELKSGRWHS